MGVMGHSGNMVELPDVDPVPPRSDLSRTDLVAVLKGLAPGWYMSGPLLPRVNLWLKSQGRDPVSAKTLGESLVRRLGVERRNGPGHARQFLITPAAVAGRDWFKDTTAGTDPAADKEQP